MPEQRIPEPAATTAAGAAKATPVALVADTGWWWLSPRGESRPDPVMRRVLTAPHRAEPGRWPVAAVNGRADNHPLPATHHR